jgi:hypothetical protein
LFHSLPLDFSSSKRRKNDKDNVSLESSSGSKRRRFKDEVFLFPENANVISLDDDEDVVEIDESGLDSEISITICSDYEKDDVIFGKDETLIFLDDSDDDDDDESEEDKTSDGDFKVDELNEATDDDNDDDKYEDEEKKIKRKRMRKDFDVVGE